MQIASAASAFPKHYYSQKFLLEQLQEYWGERLRNPQMLARLHRNVAVEGRHLALPHEKYYELKTWGCANDAWIQVAQELGEDALCRALHHAGLEPSELGALFFTSVTGISSPSIDALLINRMGLSPNIKRMPIFGLGCVAGAAGIARAADYVRAYPRQAAALVSVELCSLTIQREDLSVANLISSGLFADGSAAVVVTGDEVQSTGPEIIATRSVFYPDTERMMGWKVSEKGFQLSCRPRFQHSFANILAKMSMRFFPIMDIREVKLEAGYCTPADQKYWKRRRTPSICTMDNSMRRGIACSAWEIYRRLRYWLCWKM